MTKGREGEAGRTVTREISSECVHCVSFRWPKNNFWQILTLGGSCATPLYRRGSIGDNTKCRSPKSGKNWGFSPTEGDRIKRSRRKLSRKRIPWVCYSTPNLALIGCMHQNAKWHFDACSRLATIEMGRNWGGGSEAYLHAKFHLDPSVWTQYTNVTDRQTDRTGRQTGQTRDRWHRANRFTAVTQKYENLETG